MIRHTAKVSCPTASKPSDARELYLLRVALIAIALAEGLAAQQTARSSILLQIDPAKSGADITLVGSMHNVEGSFRADHGTIHFNSVTGAADGEIVFDATSGQTGNHSRDKKMHTDVLESVRFPSVLFRPDHADGTLDSSGDSMLQVHGQFVIHGTAHEVIFPVEVHLEGTSWTAKSSFVIPYAKWGMKNPSFLFLRVADEVKVQFHGAGTLGVHSP